jgi:cell division protein FtsB
MVWKEKRYLQYIIYIVILLFIGWLGYAIIYGKGGIIERSETQRSLVLLEEDIDTLEHKIEKIDLEIKSFKDNRKLIAGLAREYGYKREGELIFRFLPKRNKTQN